MNSECLPETVCFVFREALSGKVYRLMSKGLRTGVFPEYNSPDALFVAFFASAEIKCLRSLGMPLPANVIDLYVEFRRVTSGRGKAENNLLGAVGYFRKKPVSSLHKQEMRDLILGKSDYSRDEKLQILDYCQQDVDYLYELWEHMKTGDHIDEARAIYRGEYILSVSEMEILGIPLDKALYEKIVEKRHSVISRLIADLDQNGVYANGSFSSCKFGSFLASIKCPQWPKTVGGANKTDKQTLKDMALHYPEIKPYYELKKTLPSLNQPSLEIGDDGRNRTLLSPFASKTGRNQPSNSKFTYGLSSWFRGLINPGPGKALVYLDYKQQEFGIAAALSEDSNMKAAYASGDPYLAFAKQAGAIPQDATKESHPREREQYKMCVLAVQYGMGLETLGTRLGGDQDLAKKLLANHKATFSKFWEWSDKVQYHADIYRYLETTFGWRVNVGSVFNPRSLRNFPVQANGAEILRLAAIFARKLNIAVCAPIHDAFLIEADVSNLEVHILRMRCCMEYASEIVLRGFRIGVDAEVYHHTSAEDRKVPQKNKVIWDLVLKILQEEKC